MDNRHDGVVLGQGRCLDAPLLHGGEQHRRGREQVFPVTLDEARRRRTDDHDQVRRLRAVQAAQIFDERLFRVLVGRARRDQRVLLDVERPWRLAIEFGAHVFCIFIPRPEFAADGMKDHDPLVLFGDRRANRSEKQQHQGQQCPHRARPSRRVPSVAWPGEAGNSGSRGGTRLVIVLRAIGIWRQTDPAARPTAGTRAASFRSIV